MSVRRITAPATTGGTDAVPGSPPHSPPHPADVVGDLVGLDASTAVIETRHGLVEVALDTVTHARPVPHAGSRMRACIRRRTPVE